MNEKYKGIINQVHHQSATREHMSMYDRAAQFSSFAALTGHSDAIREEARLVDEKLQLNDEQIQELNIQLNLICDNIVNKPQVEITYFVPDLKKRGGAYITEKHRIKTVDLVKKVLIFAENKKEVYIDDVLKITGA